MSIEPESPAIPARPAWLEDEADVQALLSDLLDRLDRTPAAQRSRPLTIRLTANTLAALFRHDADAERIWSLLQSLQPQVLQLAPDRRRGPYDAPYSNARLRLAANGEPILRAWLQRPARAPYAEHWRQAVSARAEHFADGGEALAARALEMPGLTAEQLIERFAGIAGLPAQRITLRRLSARVFKGHSKFLDHREALVRSIAPHIDIEPRPVLVQVSLPAGYDSRRSSVLFIENQDSYLNAVDGRPAACGGMALVYVAGFRGGAERIRDRRGASLHFRIGSRHSDCQAFADWWFAPRGDGPPLLFWGDLDFAGMAILKALGLRFPGMRAWPAGYEPMLTTLLAGAGHTPESAAKSAQQDPGETGCPWADRTLLPALRRIGACVDQESVD